MSVPRELKFENLLMSVWKKTQSNLSLSQEKISTCDELRDYLLSPGKSDVYDEFYRTFKNFCKDDNHQGFDINSFTSFLNCESVSYIQESVKPACKESNSVIPASSLEFMDDESSMYERANRRDRYAPKFKSRCESQRVKGTRW